MKDKKSEAHASRGAGDRGRFSEGAASQRAVTPGQRFFFDLRSDTDFIPDESGIIVSDVGAICAEARRAIEEIQEDDHASVPLWEGWRLEVRDSDGNVVKVFRLDDKSDFRLALQ